MDKSSDMTATGIIEAAAKTEWQIGIEHQVEALLIDNASLRASACALQAEMHSLQSKLASA